MKTLRTMRNIAVFCIVAMALVASLPGVQPLRAQSSGRTCGYKMGFNCYIDANNQCREHHYTDRGGYGICFNSGCM
jgi:hypothetical protein